MQLAITPHLYACGVKRLIQRSTEIEPAPAEIRIKNPIKRTIPQKNTTRETNGARICGEKIGQSVKSGTIADNVLQLAHAPRPRIPADDEPSEKRREPLDLSRNAFRQFRKPIDQSCHVPALFVGSPLRPASR
jgi:hypothetical protein